MQTALTRAVSPSLGACELTWMERQTIDFARAAEQHQSYERALSELGLHVISLPAEPELPDSVFVEDPLLVLDEIAIVTRMGAASRRAEGESLAAAIAQFRPVRRITEPATLEGGDVMRVGRDLFAGLSSRTNREGIEQLRTIAEPLGYRIYPVTVRGCLHLKSACCPLGDDRILLNPEWLDVTALGTYELIPVPPEEPAAANVLRIRDSVLMPSCFPRTAETIQGEGLSVRTVDISELMKAEAAVTCSSVIFESAGGG